MSSHRIRLQICKARAFRCLRWMRFFALSIVMILSAVGLYLNRVGLPDSLRARLEVELRERGLDCEIGSVRLRGFLTLVSEDIRLNATGDADAVHAVVREAEFRIGLSSLMRFQIVPRSFIIRQGAIGFPILDTDASSTPLFLENITSRIEFLADDRWELADFQGDASGIQVRVSGTIDHASESGNSFGNLNRKENGPEWNRRFQDFVEILRTVDIAPPSSLIIRFHGDTQDMKSLEADVEIQVASAVTPWGNLKDVWGNVNLAPALSGAESPRIKGVVGFGEIEASFGTVGGLEFEGNINLDKSGESFERCDWAINVESASWDQGGIQGAELAGTTSASSNDGFWGVTHLMFTAIGIDSLGFRLQDSQFESELFHSRTNQAAISGDWRFHGGQITSEVAQSEVVDLTGKISSAKIPSWQDVLTQSGVWSDAIESARFDWIGQIEQVMASDLNLGNFEWSGQWDSHVVTVGLVHIDEDGGRLDVSARINAKTKEIETEIRSSIDCHRIVPLLPPSGGRWLRQFGWDSAPLIAATANLTIPPELPDGLSWSESVLQSLKLSGNFAIDRGSFRGVSFDAARSDFTFSNLSWRLPNLKVVRSEGESSLQYWMNSKTRDFAWTVNVRINPKSLKPMLDEEERSALDLFEFTEPVSLEGEIEGRWRDRQRLKGDVQLSSANFFYKGQKCNAFSALASLRFPLVSLTDVDLTAEDGRITAKKVVVDPIDKTMIVTDGVSTVHPEFITRAIGQKTYHNLKPYHFHEPPRILVNGRFPLGKENERKADVLLDIKGRSFQYWRFNLPEVSAQLKWLGKSVSITNLNAAFYGGKLKWNGNFDFSVRDGADFDFRGNVIDSNLQLLMSDLTSTNSAMEGSLTGNLVVTSANSDDWDSWNGFAEATIRDGSLWNIPIVGVFTPVLNQFVPESASNRASAAAGSFKIEDSVLQTSDFEVRSPAVRLRYNGSVDFDGVVNAQMQADILRDVWAVGRMVSMVFWPITKVLEFRVAGTLQEPKSMPHITPKVLLWPFQPLKTIKGILSPENSSPILTPLPNRSNLDPSRGN